MAGKEPPPGGGSLLSGASKQPAAEKLYSDKVKVNVVRSERLNRKVLEIHLITDDGVGPNVDLETVAKLFSKIGIDRSSQMMGYQISGRKIFVWFKEHCDLNKFCYQDSIRVSDGIKTGVIKLMGKREVDVKVSGLNLNTPDTLVMEYLNKHGVVKSQKVIYETDKDGPFKGLYNGDRRYLVDFSSGLNMGSYHLLDGARIRVSYAGQRRTCGRCHQTSAECPGKGLAKICETKNGERVALIDHMRAHWRNIGFEPTSFVLDTDEIDENEDIIFDAPLKNNEIFTPTHDKPKAAATLSCFNGVVVRNLPLEMSDKDIEAFLVSKGMPASNQVFKISTSKKNKNVDIEDLNTELCVSLIENIHEQVFFNRKIYCRGLRNLIKTSS